VYEEPKVILPGGLLDLFVSGTKSRGVSLEDQHTVAKIAGIQTWVSRNVILVEMRMSSCF